MSRGLPLSEAMAHVGLKRRTFDSLIRPRVTPIRVGTSLIFDVHDLDRAFDELKAASQASDTPASASEPAQNARRNGRPIPRKELNHGPINTGDPPRRRRYLAGRQDLARHSISPARFHKC